MSTKSRVGLYRPNHVPVVEARVVWSGKSADVVMGDTTFRASICATDPIARRVPGEDLNVDIRFHDTGNVRHAVLHPDDTVTWLR